MSWLPESERRLHSYARRCKRYTVSATHFSHRPGCRFSMRKEDPPREELLRTRVIQYAQSESTLPQPDGFTSETQGINGCYLPDSTTYSWISEEVERDVGQSETSNRKQRLGLILMSVAIGYNQCKALRPFACVRTGDSVPSQSGATGVVKVHVASLLLLLCCCRLA